MDLIPFSHQDYSLLVGWIPNEEFNLLWGGPLYKWPITVDQIACQQRREEISSFLLVDAVEKVGFIEISKVSESVFHLCRVLIAKETDRGKGYGRQLVKLAVEYAKTHYGAKELTLNVFEHNERAIRCYQSLGFLVLSRKEKARQFKDRWWSVLCMKIEL